MTTNCRFSWTWLVFALLLAALPGYAGSSLSPEDVVRGSISAAHKDKLSLFIRCVDLPAVAADRQSPKTPREVVKLLGSIDEDNVKLITIPPSGDNGKTVVRMVAPLALEFELRETLQPNNMLFEFVAIRP